MLAVGNNQEVERLGEAQHMVVVRRPHVPLRQHPPRDQNRTLWLGAAVVAGVICGLGGLLFVSAHSRTLRLGVPTETVAVTQTVVPVTYQGNSVGRGTSLLAGSTAPSDLKNESALEEIRIRNRRLEALVKVLRRRDANERRAASSHSN